MELNNEQCREQAEKAIAAGEHVLAMRWYNTAAARTIGHKKTDRYEAMAREQARLAGAVYNPVDYAKDTEAAM